MVDKQQLRTQEVKKYLRLRKYFSNRKGYIHKIIVESTLLIDFVAIGSIRSPKDAETKIIHIFVSNFPNKYFI